MIKDFGNTDNYTIDDQFNITAFLMDASLIVNKIGVEPELKSMFLDSAILRYLPKEINRDLVKKMIDEHGSLYVALYQKQQSNKHDVIESKFVKISDTKFIEKRDNKFYFLDYDEKTGAFSEREITGQHSDTLMRFSKETIEKFGGGVGCLTYTDMKTKCTTVYRIMFNEKFSKVTVNGREFDVIDSPMQLGDRFLIDEIMKPISDGIRTGKYVSILSDGEAPAEGVSYTSNIDTRSRIIKYKMFLEDLRANASSVPRELRKELERTAIDDLISKTYLVRPEDMEELQTHISTISLEGIVDERKLARLHSYTEQLNQARRSYVEKESQYCGVHFDSEEARKRFTESLDAKAKRKEQQRFIQDIKAFVAIEGVACIRNPLKVRTDKTHYSTIEGVRYMTKHEANFTTASAESVDYEAFCDKLKGALVDVDEDKKKEFVELVIGNCASLWYGTGNYYPGDNRIMGERIELDDRLQEIVMKRVIDDEEIDTQETARIEERYLELSREEEEICKKILDERRPLNFETDAVRRDYEAIKKVHELEIPDESKTVVIHELKAESEKNLRKKRKIDAFARLALSGEDIPSESDIKTAVKFLDCFGEKDVDRD